MQKRSRAPTMGARKGKRPELAGASGETGRPVGDRSQNLTGKSSIHLDRPAVNSLGGEL